jgi:hypothetical protein
MHTIVRGAVVVCALMALAGTAHAEEATYVERSTQEGQDIRFRDDPLGAIAGEPIGAQLGGGHPPKRFDLMRPRKSFVPELLKSIEAM